MRRANLAWRVRNTLRRNYIWGWLQVLFAQAASRLAGVLALTGELSAQLIRADGTVVDYGVLGRRVVTTVFVNDLVDELQAYAHIDAYKYHDSGEGSTPENVGDTDIETTDGESRATGSQTEDAANIYKSVGTITYSGSKAIVEHGLFSASTGGILMDRTVFSAINVSASDSIQFTYKLTLTAGS